MIDHVRLNYIRFKLPTKYLAKHVRHHFRNGVNADTLLRVNADQYRLPGATYIDKRFNGAVAECVHH